MPFDMRANRAFLGRVVRYLAEEAGIRQFLDIGTGIPTAGNTHEIAQADRARVPGRVRGLRPGRAGARPRTADQRAAGATEYIDADLRDTATILDQAGQDYSTSLSPWR